MCKDMKMCLYIVILISVIIAIYELMFWTELGFIIAILAGISAFYGYVLLKCYSCCRATKKKR